MRYAHQFCEDVNFPIPRTPAQQHVISLREAELEIEATVDSKLARYSNGCRYWVPLTISTLVWGNLLVWFTLANGAALWT